MGLKVTDRDFSLDYVGINNSDCSLLQIIFPGIDIANFLGKAVGIPMDDTTMNVSVLEYNSGALVLARNLSPEFTPRSKYYLTKTICFCEEILKRRIKLLKINTVQQLGGLFTKGLPKTVFGYLRKNIMGWQISQIDIIHP